MTVDPEARTRCDFSEPLFDRILTLMSDPPRPYHGPAHPADLDRRFLEIEWGHMLDRRLIHRFNWTHDVICRPGHTDNEAQSIAFVREHLAEDPNLDHLCRIIAASKTHPLLCESMEEAVCMDLDLAILSDPPEDYDRFERLIAEEHAVYPAEIYRKGRIAFLNGMLAREQIYRTHPFFRREAAARDNLQRAIRALERTP